MKTNLEIEFKTAISKEQYDSLITEFDLSGNIFLQKNYYFDTEDLQLKNNRLVLRIRQKGDRYKLTSKSHLDEGNFEKHILLSKEEALEMIEKGFDATMIGFDNMMVKNVCSLETYRVTTPYKNGELFFDESHYFDIVDYEIEYEADDMKEGEATFKQFLKDRNIKYVKTRGKSTRCYNAKFGIKE